MNMFAVAIRDDGGPADPAIADRLNRYADTRPFTIDGHTWIVARARLDARASLEHDLGLPPRVAANASDGELILRAFHAWGHRCVEHLLGDFGFVIWTSAPWEIFAARDHLGVEMLYYAHVGGWIVAANTIAAIRAHPGVSLDLDDAAVADFLLFDHKTDLHATTFKNIRAVPPAHVLSWDSDGFRLQRYWDFPIDEPRYRRDDDYVSELRGVVDAAVADRLRGSHASVLFSGGIDSSVVAAVARRHVAASCGDGLRLFSFTYRSLIEDDEPSFAGAQASHLGLRWDDYVVDEAHGWDDDLTVDTPEPHLIVGGGAMRRCYADIASFSPIALSGEGPDNALFYEWRAYIAHLIAGRRWARLACDAAGFLRHERRLPRLSALLATTDAADTDAVTIPPWMSPALVKDLELAARVRYVMRPPESIHPTKPIAHFSFSLPLWQHMFERLTPPYTHAAMHVSHPFVDLRVLRFLMSVPVIPWCRNKYLLRRAFREELSPVSRRAKTPLRGDPSYEKVRRDGMPDIVRSSRLEHYAIAAPKPSTDSHLTLAALRLAALSHWLEKIDRAAPAAAAS